MLDAILGGLAAAFMALLLGAGISALFMASAC
jgi:hypothetical protein